MQVLFILINKVLKSHQISDPNWEDLHNLEEKTIIIQFYKSASHQKYLRLTASQI